nr:sigma-70 family RNA polymerase sigma factor [Bdellovibrio sp. NC01]
MELSKLMSKAQAGDGASYKQALTLMSGLLSKYLRNSLRRFKLPLENSEDLVQEVLLAIHQKRETYNSEQFFLPWMYAIARHKMIDYLRRAKVQRSMVSLEDELENIEALMTLESDHSLDAEKLLALLSPKQREVLQMVKIEGLSIDEVAKKTGYSASDVKVTVHRAIKSLKDQVQGGML